MGMLRVSSSLKLPMELFSDGCRIVNKHFGEKWRSLSHQDPRPPMHVKHQHAFSAIRPEILAGKRSTAGANAAYSFFGTQ